MYSIQEKKSKFHQISFKQMPALPIRPPGTAYCRSFCSANSDTIRENIGLQVSLPSLSFDTMPGRTSIS